MKKEQNTTHTVVNEMRNSWVETSRGRKYDTDRDCGHRHRTLEAAEKCQERLTRHKEDGWWDAAWHNSAIHDQFGYRGDRESQYARELADDLTGEQA